MQLKQRVKKIEEKTFPQNSKSDFCNCFRPSCLSDFIKKMIDSVYDSTPRPEQIETKGRCRNCKLRFNPDSVQERYNELIKQVEKCGYADFEAFIQTAKNGGYSDI